MKNFDYLRRPAGFYGGLFRISLPIFAQDLINSLLNVLDTFMVGGLGENAMSGVMFGNNLCFILMLFVFGCQSGMSLIISQYWGKRDLDSISRVLGIGLFAATGVTVIVCTVFMVFPQAVMRLMSGNAEIVEIGAEYLRRVAPAHILNAVTLMLTAAFRSMENAKIGLFVSSSSLALNTFLCYTLIFGKFGMPALGVAGAAYAMVLARAFGLILILIYVFKNTDIRFLPRKVFRPGLSMTRDFMRYSLPVIVNETLWGLGSALYTAIVGHIPGGTAADSAAFSFANSVAQFLNAPLMGIGAGAAVVMGKHLGSDEPEPYETGKAILTAASGAALLVGVLTAVVSLTAMPSILPAVYDNMGAAQVSLICTLLLICALRMPLGGTNFTLLVGTLRAGGDVKVATFIDLGCLWLIGLPVALITGRQGGVVFVFIGILCEETSKIALTVGRFRQKKWIKNITH